jgi:endonuclease/exonuclease/phosphatase family metal-dependent hydrolase
MFDPPGPLTHPLAAHDAASPWAGRLRVVSWNLLRRVGAGAADVASLIRQTRPDLLLLQEATAELEALPDLVGGHFFRDPMQRRIYGLGAWSPHAIPKPAPLCLPVSVLPGGVPQRIAQLVRLGGATFANVHLSHGQFLNRWQLLHIIRRLQGPAAIIGDFNAVGPTQLPGFRDIGPRQSTHLSAKLMPLRLDRCLASGLVCDSTKVLDRGRSDHHPIVLELVRDGS